ncbi:hypothetical protein [Clostridium thailandense]|uniref:hypothetical protein n=1 Tax=Clostridium thailandense TaxID=2794346 RepID=UPI003988ED02
MDTVVFNEVKNLKSAIGISNVVSSFGLSSNGLLFNFDDFPNAKGQNFLAIAQNAVTIKPLGVSGWGATLFDTANNCFYGLAGNTIYKINLTTYAIIWTAQVPSAIATYINGGGQYNNYQGIRKLANGRIIITSSYTYSSNYALAYLILEADGSIYKSGSQNLGYYIGCYYYWFDENEMKIFTSYQYSAYMKAVIGIWDLVAGTYTLSTEATVSTTNRAQLMYVLGFVPSQRKVICISRDTDNAYDGYKDRLCIYDLASSTWSYVIFAQNTPFNYTTAHGLLCIIDNGWWYDESTNCLYFCYVDATTTKTKIGKIDCVAQSGAVIGDCIQNGALISSSKYNNIQCQDIKNGSNLCLRISANGKIYFIGVNETTGVQTSITDNVLNSSFTIPMQGLWDFANSKVRYINGNGDILESPFSASLYSLMTTQETFMILENTTTDATYIYGIEIGGIVTTRKLGPGKTDFFHSIIGLKLTCTTAMYVIWGVK